MAKIVTNALRMRISVVFLGVPIFLIVIMVVVFLRPDHIAPAEIAMDHIQMEQQPNAAREISPGGDLPLTWPVPDMQKMKTHGCVADGLLSGYNSPKNDIPLARESNCYYFHRALETWRAPPDFKQAHEVIEEMNRPDAIYGFFIAEAIDKKADYFYRAENRDFDFDEMCGSGSKNYWGEHTCKPSFKQEEYQAYLKQITRDAMDSGIQVFLFGQISHQEENILYPKVDNIIREMRAYAESINMEIIIGAQTGDITNKKYLAYFDFIEGGIGVRSDGEIEEGPCYSKYWKVEGDWCWPMMWHPEFADRAENILVYMDWNGQIGDDMSVFTLMSDEKRHNTLTNYRTFFLEKNIGFMLPLIAPLPRDNGGCHGSRKGFYSPDMNFGCRDIDVINELLSEED